MKILSLDLGDVWVGSAISDALGITCKPYKTVNINDLVSFLEKTVEEENIQTIVIGKPTTLKGTESEQTKKIISQAKELENKFCNKKIKWILWDERLSSKWAGSLNIKKNKTKEDKQKEHSVAAAFILQSYLDNLALYKK